MPEFTPPTPTEKTPEPSLESILSALLSEVQSLRSENAEIKNKQSIIEAAVASGNSPFIVPQGSLDKESNHSQAVDNDKFARHATLVTRPVVDNPQDYKYLVFTSQLKRGD